MQKPCCILVKVMMTTFLNMKHVHLISRYWVEEEED